MTKPRNRSVSLIRKEACADVKGSEAPDTQGSGGFRNEAIAPDTRLIHPNIGDETLPSLQEQGFEPRSKDSRGGLSPHKQSGRLHHHPNIGSGAAPRPNIRLRALSRVLVYIALHEIGGPKNARSYAQCLQKRCQDYSRERRFTESGCHFILHFIGYDTGYKRGAGASEFAKVAQSRSTGDYERGSGSRGIAAGRAAAESRHHAAASQSG